MDSTEVHLGACETSVMELYVKFTFFAKQDPSYVFDRIKKYTSGLCSCLKYGNFT